MAVRVFKRLRDLLDVNTSGVADGDALVYDEATSKWIPGAGGGGGSDDQTAAEVPFTPAGNIAANDVQEAIEELDSEKAAAAHTHSGSDITSGTVAEARIDGAIARDSEVTAAVSAHDSDTTNVHGIPDTSALALTANHPSNATFNDHSARHENGGADEISIAGLDGTPTELTNHLNDASDAHDASAISVLDTNGDYTATDVEGVLAEIAPQLGGGTPDAEDVAIADAGGYYTGTEVETALQEVGAKFDEIAYVEFTAPVTISATSAASPNDVVSAGAIAFPGGERVKIEFWCPYVEAGATATSYVVLALWEGSTDLGRLAGVGHSALVFQPMAPCYATRFLTPSAGTKTYKVVAYRSNSNGTVTAGAGGADTPLPGYIRITRAP